MGDDRRVNPHLNGFWTVVNVGPGAAKFGVYMEDESAKLVWVC
jgi:hypothetical protein